MPKELFFLISNSYGLSLVFDLNSLLQLDLGELGHLVKLELPDLASKNIGCLVKVVINIEWFIRISMSPMVCLGFSWFYH